MLSTSISVVYLDNWDRKELQLSTLQLSTHNYSYLTLFSPSIIYNRKMNRKKNILTDTARFDDEQMSAVTVIFVLPYNVTNENISSANEK